MLRQLSRSLSSHTLQAFKLGFGSEFAAARGISQHNGAICTSSQPTSSTNSTLAPGSSAATTSHLRPNATWSDVPAPAKILGLAGVIPFIALSPPIAASLPLLPAELVQNAALLQVAYGASIASFLGGIHWAMAMAEYGGKQASSQMGTDRYVWSVTPCLMAWPAVVMAPGPASLAIASVLAVVHAVDGRFAVQRLLPQWYMVLRRPLSAFAISGMLITLVGSFVYPEGQQTQLTPAIQEKLES
ncbi:TPA: hypothetical protein ACH3X2_008188 [Trebouxia sp. C0005]